MNTLLREVPPGICAQDAPLRLLYVRRAHCGGDLHTLPHAHPFTELYYVLNGRGRFQVENDRIALSADDLLVVNPHVEHTEWLAGDTPPEYIVMGLSGQTFHDPAGCDSRFVHLSCAARREECLFYLKQLLDEMEQRAPGYEAVCHNIAQVLAAKLVRRTAYAHHSAEAHKRSKECAKARRYMDENFRQAITLDTLAAVVHVNKYHLSHLFNREMGCSPINYLIARRIEEGKHLLESTNYSVSQISRHLGFSSPSYFSQSFKRLVGQGPSEYRRSLLGHRPSAKEAYPAHPTPSPKANPPIHQAIL